MLYATTAGAPRQAIGPGQAVPPAALWLDLFDPTEAERSLAEAATGLRVPDQAEIVEIETSSRLRLEGDGIYLTTPMAAPNADGSRTLTALGVVLSPRYLVTLRFAALPVFDAYAQRLATPAAAPQAISAAAKSAPCSLSVLIGLLEALVDRLADVLEHAGGDLDVLSRRIFHTDHRPVRPRQEDLLLRSSLRRIGLAGDMLSSLRASLLGIGRIVPFLADNAAPWLPEPLQPRVAALRQDIASLADYDAQLMNKMQFLLDATLGFLNIEQNNGLKILTVVSVVGIPPTLIASIYGMNFKNMPELSWAWGYPYGLGLIVLSIVLPLVWFKVKGWI